MMPGCLAWEMGRMEFPSIDVGMTGEDFRKAQGKRKGKWDIGCVMGS